MYEAKKTHVFQADLGGEMRREDKGEVFEPAKGRGAPPEHVRASEAHQTRAPVRSHVCQRVGYPLSTFNRQPSTLHPPPSPLDPRPYTVDPGPETLYTPPYTPYTLDPRESSVK